MATDLERLVVSIEANTRDVDNKLRLLTANFNNSLGTIENRTSRFSNTLESHFLSISRITRNLTIGFAAVQAFRFGENVVENFDKIAEHAHKLGVEVDASLVNKMREVKTSWETAWVSMQVATARAVDPIVSDLAKLSKASQGVMFPNARNTLGLDQTGGFNSSADPMAQHFRAAAAGIPFATDAQFLAAQKELAKAQEERNKKLAEEQKQIDLLNAQGNANTFEKIRAEIFATAGAKNVFAQQQAETQQEIDNANANALEKMRQQILEEKGQPARDQAKIVDEMAKRSTESADRLKERVIGDFAQTAAAVAIHSKNIGDTIRGFMQSIATAILESTFKDAFADFSIKNVTKYLGFAEGGRPPVGVPSWVGERGRELFVPDVPGTIYPNRSAVGGSNYFDLRGAVVTQDLLDQMNAISRRNSASAMAQAVKASDSRFARNYDMTIRDKR